MTKGTQKFHVTPWGAVDLNEKLLVLELKQTDMVTATPELVLNII